jgi:hypothetical protein
LHIRRTVYVSCFQIEHTLWEDRTLGFSSQERVILQTARPNVLLIGGDAEVEEVLRGLDRIIRRPVVCSRASALTLPAKFDGSFVVRDAEALDMSGQQRLLEWLASTEPSPQVITTSLTPLFPLVQRGAFADALYYRLNQVTLILTPRRARVRDTPRGDRAVAGGVPRAAWSPSVAASPPADDSDFTKTRSRFGGADDDPVHRVGTGNRE